MNTTSVDTLFDQLCAELGAAPDRKGEVWVDCPSCGKGKKHFSFNARTGHCFSCDYRGSLRQIADLLGAVVARPAPRVQRPAAPPRPDFWQAEPGRWLDRYCAAHDRLERWQGYKPLSIDSIAGYRLGVGKLPMWSEQRRAWYEWPHRRLIVPLWGEGPRIVGFYGRAFEPQDQGPKWLGASGTDKSHLFLAGTLAPGCTVVIVENYVDAILACQAAPAATYAACGGATWREPWTQQIAAARPAHVLVWLDNDMAGCPNAATYVAMRQAWLAAHPGKTPPEPRGPQIANDLLAAGLRTHVYAWPTGTPAKADIGSVLQGAL